MAVQDTVMAVRSFGSDVPADERRGQTSAAAIGKHPIHPVLIPYPIAFLTATVATDVAFARTGDPFWARASEWLLRAGLASGTLAAVFGIVDYTAIERTRRHPVGHIHAVGNATALVLAAANLMARREDPGGAIMPRGLAMSAAIAALLGLTAWAGGELVYRHRVAVIED